MIFFSLFAGSYCLASGIHSYIRYKNIMNNNLDGNNQVSLIPGKISAVEFIGYKTSLNVPMYIDAGNSGNNLPIGGGISDEEVKLYFKFFDYDSFNNYQIIKDKGTSKFINNNKTLNEELLKYNIHDTEFPMSLPMKMIEYKYTNGVYLLDKYASSNLNNIAIHYALKKRYPLSIFILSCVFTPLVIIDYLRYNF
jgi:hypothetical protein